MKLHPRPTSAAGSRRRLVCLALLIALLGLASSPASAQLRNLDDARFIQGLRERNMRTLLRHFLENNPPKDELAQLEVLIETNKLDASDEAVEPARRVASMEAVLDNYRKLIASAPVGHHKLPVWRTDFTEYALRTVLTIANVNATEFVEFGIPTGDQRQAYDKIITEAWQFMEDAAVDQFMLVGSLPREKDFEARFVNTGFWRTFTEEYGNIKIPYYRAWTTLAAQFLKKPQGNLAEAAAQLEQVSQQSITPSALAELRSLQGRVALGLKKPADATKHLTEVLSLVEQKKAGPFDAYVAHLAMSKVLQSQKKTPEALAQLATIRDMELVKKSPMLLVLSFDRQVQITGDKNAYLDLFNHPAAGPYKAAIETFVRSRLVDASPVASPDELDKAEGVVVLANVDALMARGGEAQQEASQATGEDQKKLQTEATGKFTAARDALTKLLDRKDLPANLRAEAMFKLGACHYQLDNLPGAVETWTKLGSDLPQESVSANAVINAFIIARDLWQNNQKNDTAIKLFDNASSVLLTKFAPAKIGDDPVSLHWHTRGSFLRQLNRHTEAVEAFDQFVKLNPRNPLIPDALYQSLISRQALLAGVEGSDRTKVAEATLAAANAAITALEAAAKASRGEQASAQLYQAGDATLRKAEVLTGGLNQYAQAKVLLGDFDGKFKQFPDLLRAKREMSISLMMSMGQAADALSEIRQLMAQFPNEGGALINGVLLAVNKQIDDLLLVGRKDDAIKLAGVGVELSTFLLDWATKQPEYREPAKLLPFQIMNTRQLVMAQRYQDALDIYDQIITTDAGKTNFDVIYGRARALHKLGRNEEALPLVNMLLRLGETKQGQDEWWDTWMMRVTILDTQFEAQTNGENKDPVKAKKTSATIFTSIEKLKLIDKELGGSKFRDRFQQLQNKHFPK